MLELATPFSGVAKSYPGPLRPIECCTLSARPAGSFLSLVKIQNLLRVASVFGRASKPSNIALDTPLIFPTLKAF